MLFVRCHTRSLLTWTVYSPPSFYTFALTVDRHHSLSPCAGCRAHRKPPPYLYFIRHLAPARNASNQRPFSIFPSARSSSQVACCTYDSLDHAVGATSAHHGMRRHILSQQLSSGSCGALSHLPHMPSNRPFHSRLDGMGPTPILWGSYSRKYGYGAQP